jgi:MOB kinase activator 1
MVSEQCTAETCPTMRAGPKFEYYWSDGDVLVKCAAPTYIDYLLTSVRLLLEDEAVFPSQIGKHQQFWLYFYV